jgi:hypothetical protein
VNQDEVQRRHVVSTIINLRVTYKNMEVLDQLSDFRLSRRDSAP